MKQHGNNGKQYGRFYCNNGITVFWILFAYSLINVNFFVTLAKDVEGKIVEKEIFKHCEEKYSYPQIHSVKQQSPNNSTDIFQLKNILKNQLKLKNSIARKRFLLISDEAKHKILSYENKKQIGSVPLDERDYGKIVFKEHIDNLSVVQNSAHMRTPLLCNHGIAGTGKSVQQALNMKWFLDHFKNGVAIEINYNDDAPKLRIDPTKIKDQFQFESSIVQSIMLRLIEFCYGTNYSIQPTGINQYLTWDFATMISEFYPDDRTLDAPLKFVRAVLDLPDDAPILLSVDELVKLKDKSGDISSYLSLLCREVDDSGCNDIRNNWKRTLWLSVSIYGCFPLTKFIADSNREINLPPLTNFSNHT